MGALTGCIKKAGKYLPADDKAAILAAARELRKGGMSASDAANEAISRQLGSVQQALRGFDEALRSVPVAESSLPPKVAEEKTVKAEPVPATTPKVEGASKDDARFSRDKSEPAAPRGVSMADAEKVVDGILTEMPNAPQIVLFNLPAEAPAELRALIEKAGASNDVEAVYWEGKIYAFLGNVSSRERLAFVLAHHEIRHHGLSAILGGRLDATMQRIYSTNASVKVAADRIIANGLTDSVTVATEEALADMQPEDLTSLRGWKGIVQAMREWLRKIAGRLQDSMPGLAQALRPGAWSDADIAGLIGRAEDVSRVGGAEFMRGGAVFGKRTNLTEAQRAENFKQFGNNAPVIPSSAAKAHVFKTGESVVVEAYHGTARPDRVGTIFKPQRATSGPMAFFTSEPALASSYAQGKQDTSLSAEDQSYQNWFKIKLPGARSAVSIDRAWYGLSPEVREKVAARMPDIRTDDDGNVIYEKGGGDLGSYAWELKQTQRGYATQGNPLKAATETWLTSGALYDQEEKFLTVLELAGIPKGQVEFDSPHASFPFVYKTFIAMRNPLVTSDMPQSVTDALNAAAKKDRSRALAQGNDMWDKNTRTLREWVQNFNDPANNNAAYVWTSIPDKVTNLFKSLGYDGIIDYSAKSGVGVSAPVYIPFQETQVKSAIGNNGQFDLNKKDIRYSRQTPDQRDEAASSGPMKAMASALRGIGDTRLPGTYIVNDFIRSNGKLSWWDKSVGTMNNLAERNPLFKPVYDRANDFLNAVSTFATEAADMAPNLLPQLKGFRDIFRKPVSAADTKAIQAPIFEGTLSWTRDKAGNIVAEPDVQKAGVVWTDAEMRERFKSTDAQIKLYREFNASVNKSLTDLSITDMLRFAGKDALPVVEAAVASGDVTKAAKIITDHLATVIEAEPKRAGVLLDTGAKVNDKAKQAVSLMDRGYAPLMRFGHYTLDVTEKGTDKRLFFGRFEDEREGNMMARKMRVAYPDAKIVNGTMSDLAYQLYAGVSPETLELFGDMLGLESKGDDAASQAFQEYLKLTKNNRSAMKRLIERKGIAGFSEDAGRVLAGFVYSNSRQAAKNLHLGRMMEAVQDVGKDKAQGELLDTANKLYSYVANPTEEAQKIKGLLFMQFLGGSIAAGMVNLTQVPMVAFPWLTQYGGASKAAGQITRGLADAMKWETARSDAGRTTGDKVLDAAIKRAEEAGTISPQEVHSLIAQAGGAGALRSGDGTNVGDLAAKGSNFLSKLALAWGRPFAIAEQFNRRATFIAAYRTAVEQGMADPFAFATKGVNETQFGYTKANRPEWARGAIGSVLFTFKTYSISYVELLSRMAQNGPEGRKAALIGLGVLFLMSGAQGLPGADDLDDVIDGLLQRMGYNFSSKMAKREFFAKLFGQDGARFMMRGVSGLPGVPIDFANRLGLGNLWPGTGLLTKKADHTSDVLELAGPAGSFAKQLFTGADKLTSGDIGGAVKAVLPIALANAVQAADMMTVGMYRVNGVKKVIDTDAYDAAAKLIGFQPNNVARVQDATRQEQQLINLHEMRKTEIADQWAKSLFEKDRGGIQDARDALAQWNKDNPESPIRITTAQLRKRMNDMNEDKVHRIERTAPKEIRATVRRELSEAL